jgi:formate dehydrogenase maturation protein FdhE
MSNDLTHTDKELNHCPACGSDDITYTDTFNGSIPVSCMDCDAQWYEVWTYAGIMMVQGEVKE